MKQPISRYTTRNTLMAPIGAVLAADVPHIDAQPSLHTHLLAQHLAMALGTVVLPGYAFRDQPGCDQDWGGETAPFNINGPIDMACGPAMVFERQAAFAEVLAASGLSITAADLDAPDFHGPYLVKGCTSPRVAMVFVAEHCSTETCECIAVSLWLAWPESDLLLSDARGRYIPRDFCLSFIGVTADERDSVSPPIYIETDGEAEGSGARALYCTDGGDGVCEWVPGQHVSIPTTYGGMHVLDAYAECQVDNLWEFCVYPLGAVLDCLNPDSQSYWESWDVVQRWCKARLQVVGCTFVDGVQQETFAEFDGDLEQNGDLWLVFTARN